MTRKQKMKVYHGIPKSITDEHTLFYESCDGKLDNLYTVINPISFYPNVTGYGVYGTTTDEFNFALTTECKIQTKVFTVDFWATMKTPVNSSYAGRLFEITFNNNSNYKIRLEKDASNNRFHLWENANLIFGEFDFSSANINKPHHFRIIFKVGDYCKMYIDGKEPNIVQYQNKLTTTFEYISHIRLSGANFSVSDFHISNIDRGDYFPNLPQDFIDGKAVIKPRMGQQQIKGDPMYSQVTNLKVPSESSWGVYYNPTASSDGLYASFDNPELSARGTNTWVSGSKIKIKGLNGEIISGIVDTDTALCRVVSMINATNVIVDSVNALAVGDTVKWLNPTNHTVSTATATITEIDSATKRISFTGDSVTDGIIGRYVIETTASSSSPTVKTKEGTNVVGTWSGLGTNEATFTLGANSNITGKDLYVTYALTMPLGNSDFPEIPYSIEKAWGENGVEMKPVDEIMIVDDFKGKIALSDKACPHKMGYGYNSKLLNPSEITETKFSRYYESLSKLDGIVDTSTSNSETAIPQQLFSFNIIEMVERKLGCEIPSRDKVQWLKENLDSSASIVHYGYGVHPTGNLLKINWFNPAMNEWTLNGGSHASGSISKLENGTSMLADRIDSNGFVHILIYTNASNDAKSSTIHTDYVCLKIKLKVDSTYTALYCENTRAREDVCNPVLIQKETKTVKRYLPSKEIFSTECLYAEFKNEGVVSGLDILANKHVNIGVTTSKYNKFVSGSKINLNQLPLEKSEHLYTPILDSKIMDSIPNHVGVNITELPVIHWWSDNGNKLFTVPTTETLNFKTCVNGTNALKGQIGGYKDVNNNIIIYGDVDKSNILTKDGLRLYDISLVNKDGELMLYVIKSSEGNRFYFYNDAITLIKVPYRPLIK